MQKIYCRSIRPDGYGEGVVPEMEEPKQSAYVEYIGTDLEGRDRYIPDYAEYKDAVIGWKRKLASLPVLYLIHPSIAKVGWVGEHKERYEVMDTEGWRRSTKEMYDSDVDGYRRIVLVPVEGNHHACAHEALCDTGHGYYYCPMCNLAWRYDVLNKLQSKPTDKAEKKEVVIPRPTLTDKELVDKVQDWVSKLCKTGGDAWTLRVPVDINHDPDILITELCRRFTAKPTPVTGEAVEFDKFLSQARDHFVISISNQNWDTELRTAADSFLIAFDQARERLQAASRTSDAVEFAEWKDKYFQFTYVHLGKGYRLRYYEYVKEIAGVLYGEHYDVKDIYSLFLQFKQQNTKP